MGSPVVIAVRRSLKRTLLRSIKVARTEIAAFAPRRRFGKGQVSAVDAETDRNRIL